MAHRKRTPKFRLIEPSKATGDTDHAIKLRVQRAVAMHIRETTGGVLSVGSESALQATGAELVAVVIEALMRTAVKEGYFLLPGGYGSFRLQSLRGRRKRLPSGDYVKLAEHRTRLRFEEGAAIKELLGMPYKSNYQKKYRRRSRMSGKACDVAFPDGPG